ncbi:MAG: MobF family relaxase, partial [Polaromonas sp.]
MSVSHKKSGGSGAYYINCMRVAGKDADKAIAEYYASATLDSAKEKAGIWYAGLNADGTRDSKLGIVDGLVFESVKGRSDVQMFSRLCQGFHGLKGDKCVKNAGSQKRVAFHDFTLSHPKDVTVLWAFSDDKTKAVIEAAQEASARVFLDFMSQHSISRQGTDGVLKTPAPLRGATFMHRSSRENDPLLHTHCVVLNICERPDGTTGSLETHELMKYQGAGASLAHASMAWSLRQLGFSLERAGKLYKTGHVPADVIKNFSKRHEQIVKATEARMLAMGMKPDAIKASREMRQLANAQTKASKSKLTMEQLQALWNAEGARLGFGQKEVAAFMHAGVPVELTKEQLFKEAQEAVRVLTENAAVFREPQLIVAIATHLVGRASPAQIMAAVEQVKNEVLLRTITEKIQGKGTAWEARTEETLYSTREMVALEHRMMDLATTTHSGHVFDMSQVKLNASLKDEQRQAIVQILSDPLMVTLVNGAPGAGKTFAMGALARAVEAPCGTGKGQGGGNVLGLSGSWSASLNLKEEAGLAEGRAITGWVHGVRSGKIAVEPRTVILVDEAGQVAAADMEAILAIAKAHGCKVVLLGDLQQQKGAGAGDAFRCMAAHLKPAELNEIVRQHKPEDRKAVKLLLAGGVNTAQGLQNFIDQGAVHLVIGDEQTNARMAADWQAMRQARPAQLALELADFERRSASGALKPREKPPVMGLHLMLAADKVSVAALNALAHNHRKAAGELGQSLWLRNLDCAKDETVEFSVNDRVAFRINSVGDCVSFSRKKDTPGEVRQDGIIESATGDILAVRMGSGELIKINQRKIKVFNRQVGTIERMEGATLYIRNEDGRLVEMDTQAEKWAHQDGGTGLQHAYACTVYSAQGLTVMAALCKSAVNTNSAQTGVALSRHTRDAHVYIDKQAHYEKKMSECRTDDWHHIDKYSDAECMKSVVAAMAQASKKASTLDYESWQESAGAKIDVQAEVVIRQRAATQALAKSELERIRQASRYQEIIPIAPLPYQGRQKFVLKEIEETPGSTILG